MLASAMNVQSNNHRTGLPSSKTERSLSAFLHVLFEPSDLIEIRAIETWTADGKRKSRLVERFWLRSSEILANLPRLNHLNQSANIFFSVNPRAEKSGTKRDVNLCRCVWIDLDHVTVAEAKSRWQALGMQPTVVVDSGHGVHAYFRLNAPIAVTDPVVRSLFEATVRDFAKLLGGDATSDCSRLLRLPGTWNVKELRNGATPARCTIEFLDEECIFSPLVFQSAVIKEEAKRSQADHERNKTAELCAMSPLALVSFRTAREQRRIRGILKYLDRDVEDRSRRDLGALVLLIQAGLSKGEVRALVMDRSKFAEAGERYFERTFEAALKRQRR